MKIKTWLVSLLSLLLVQNLFANDQKFLREKTLELLKKYCPNGNRIVHLSMEHSPSDNGKDFTQWISEGNDEKTCVNSINTVVHEEYHGLDISMSRVVLKEKKGSLSDNYYDYGCYYLKDGQFTLVKKTETFPSKEMMNTIPDRLRTFRFSYIDSDPVQSTQVEGIYGLFDEMNAYYHGTQASLDLLKYYEKKGAAGDWHGFFQDVNGTYYGCLEFKYYILKYLMFAKDHHPEIYQALMENKNFIYTFLAADRNVINMIQYYFDTKKAIFERLRSYGWKVVEDDQMLMITINNQGSGCSNFLDVYNLLLNEIQKPEYQQIMQNLTDRIRGWKPELYYHEPDDGFSDSGTPDEKLPENPEKEPEPLPEPLPEPVPQPEPAEPPVAENPGLKYTTQFSDAAGDVNMPFVDLKSGSIQKIGAKLVVRMALVRLSNQLSFNQPAVDKNTMEYEWSVYFDVDGDGDDDYSLGYSGFKMPGTRTVLGGIVENAQLNLWQLREGGGSSVNVEIQGKQQGNELILEVPGCTLVSEIGEKTLARFQTFYSNGKDYFQDLMPE